MNALSATIALFRPGNRVIALAAPNGDADERRDEDGHEADFERQRDDREERPIPGSQQHTGLRERGPYVSHRAVTSGSGFDRQHQQVGDRRFAVG